MNQQTHEDIRHLTAGIRRGLDLDEGRLSADVANRARDLLAKTDARMRLGEDLTVVAFAGSTGSGKSSLFNAVAGLEIARVGVRRPTTSRPTACVWGDGGEEILSWLSVPADNRMWRESALDGADQAALRGLILLDLPDHDSIAPEHRQESDRLVGLVDVVFWVVDPQKYADFSLHSHYLSAFSEHSANMVIVLNQVDTLAPAEQQACRAHLRQLLVQDGLDTARIQLASAVTREGVTELRETLTEAVSTKEAAAERLLADMRSLAVTMREELGEPLIDPTRLPGADRLVDAMADAAGVTAVAQTVRDDYLRRAYKKTGYPPLAWAERGQADPLGAKHGGTRDDLIRASAPETSCTQSARVNLAAHELVAEAVHSLPVQWRHAMSRAEKRSTAELTHTLDAAVTAVEIERRQPDWWPVAGFFQVLFFLATILGALWLVLQLILTLTAALGEVSSWLWIVPGALLGLGIAGSVVTSRLAASARSRGAQEAGAEADARVRAAVEEAAAGSYLEPITAILGEHKAVYDSLC